MPAVLFRARGVAALAALLAAYPALAQQAPAASGTFAIAPDRPGSEINPSAGNVTLTAPVMDGPAYLGDATITLTAEGTVLLSAERLLTLLELQLAASSVEALRATLARNNALAPADLRAYGITVRYDPQTLQVELGIPAASRAASIVDLAGEPGRKVAYLEPAEFSAYLNVRGSLDWVQQGQDEGLQSPVTFLDGAARFAGVVLESEANWQPGGSGIDFQRRGTRLVYDDRANLARWSAGDLLTVARGFQSAPVISGVGVSRFYSILEPQTIVRPRGSRSFQLDRRSLIEVRINGQLVRRVELEPGSYDLQDFPFTQGANDVELTITDDTGRTQRLDFNIFLDQAQLAQGLSEFGFYAGVLAPLGLSGPRYTDTPAITGFYRRGLSDRLTLGANLQADPHGWMAGGEGVVATSFGSLAAFASASHLDGVGRGWATLVSFQRTIARRGVGADALSLSVETRSPGFAPVGVRQPFNPYSVVVGATYNTSFNYGLYAGADVRYSRGRRAEPDVTSLRGTLGWIVSPRLSLTGDAGWERDQRGSRFSTFVSLTYRLNRRSNVRADFDSRYDRGRLSYQTFGGSGVGAYSLSADVEHSEIGAGASMNASYFANRAELGFSHFGLFERDLGGSTGQRSSLRFGTALAVADGAFAIGRPIYDAFAIVDAHRSIREHEILVDPLGDSAVATTGSLGTALQPGLSSYSDRSLAVAAPEAPITLDLGAGAYRLQPPYRAGYRLTVGSDYNVSAVGRLLGESGEPVALLSGLAVEVDQPNREPVPFFTNRDGRFGVTGLAPGRWRLTLPQTGAVYEIDVPERQATLRLGDLRPGGRD